MRSSQWEIFRHEVTDSITASTLAAVRQDRAIDSIGTLAVIADDAIVQELHDDLRAVLGNDVALGTGSLSRPITVLSPRTAKGLEFDAVVLVDPPAIVGSGTRGASSLYVAATRSTQRLHIVTAGGTGLL